MVERPGTLPERRRKTTTKSRAWDSDNEPPQPDAPKHGAGAGLAASQTTQLTAPRRNANVGYGTRDPLGRPDVPTPSSAPPVAVGEPIAVVPHFLPWCNYMQHASRRATLVVPDGALNAGAT